MGGEILRNPQKSHGAGHVIVGTLGKGGGVIVGGKDNVLFPLPGHIQHNVVAFALVLPLLQCNLRCLGSPVHKGDGSLGIDIHTGDLVALVNVAPQLPLVNIKIHIIGIAVIGNKAHRAVFQQILVEPIAHVAVHQNDLAPALAEGPGIPRPQVIKGRFHHAAARVPVALAGDRFPVHPQSVRFHIRHIHAECFQACFQAHIGHPLPEIFRGLQFLLSSAHTDIGCVMENLHNLIRCHDFSSCISVFVL